jgi:hypothetical protein
MGNGMVARTEVSRAGTLSACLSASLVLLAAAPGHAQSPAAQAPPSHTAPQPKPVTGFVSSYEILRTVRAAGFTPLSPPLREGTVYVLRATDYRGIPMRVVLDARTGVIRDVNRIVSTGPAEYGMTPPQYGPPPYVSGPFAPAPYGPPAYVTPTYGPPAEYRAPPAAAGAADEGAEPPSSSSGAVAARPMTRAQVSARPTPPLPRPRPATIGLQHPLDRRQPDKTGKPAGATAASAQAGSGATVNPSGIDAGSTPTHSPAPSKPLVPPLTY